MAVITTTTLDSSGLTLSDAVAADAGGDEVDPGVIVAITNGDASPHTATLVTPQVVDGDLAVDDRDVVVAAGETELIRVPRSYQNATSGLVDITYDAVTAVTIIAFK